MVGGKGGKEMFVMRDFWCENWSDCAHKYGRREVDRESAKSAKEVE